MIKVKKLRDVYKESNFYLMNLIVLLVFTGSRLMFLYIACNICNILIIFKLYI